MKLSKLLTNFCLITSLSACAQFKIADIGPMVTLPASGDCYRVTVVSKQKSRLPKPECDEIKKRAIFITSEDWKKQRISIQRNCQYAECKELVGAFDALFLTIDDALGKIPTP